MEELNATGVKDPAAIALSAPVKDSAKSTSSNHQTSLVQDDSLRENEATAANVLFSALKRADVSNQGTETSAMNMMAAAAATAAQFINAAPPSAPLLECVEKIPNHISNKNGVAAVNKVVAPQINPIISKPDTVMGSSINISGGGVPIKKRKSTNTAVVVNASDMDNTSSSRQARIMNSANTTSTKYIPPLKSGGILLSLPSANGHNRSTATFLKKQQQNTTNMNNLPPTPLGPVVESGQEQTGRWTREEHESFLAALQKYGKEWKKVAAKVKTRTVVQTRTHAQKYFQKLQKAMAAGNNDVKSSVVDAMMMMAKDEDGSNLGPIIIDTSIKKKKPLIQTKSNVEGLCFGANISGTSKEKDQAEATKAAAQLMAQMSSSSTLSNLSDKKPNMILPTMPTYQVAEMVNRNMKIMVPSNERVQELGKATKYIYPEPSPAACGKRKLAEIVAAQMLAGVAASGIKHPGVPPQLPLSSDAPYLPTSCAAVKNEQLQNMSNNSNHAKPNVGYNGSSLQIVNPDTLSSDISGGGRKRQRWMMGNTSPGTPWDGQLEALIVKTKSQQVQSSTITASPSPPISSSGSFSPASLPPLEAERYRCAVHAAVVSADINAVTQLMKNNGLSSTIHKDQYDFLGYTPLHSAACLKKNALEITKLILSMGADGMERDKDGNTALHWAARAGNCDVAQVLVLSKCYLDAVNFTGETPLHWAMRSGLSSVSVVRTLLVDGASPGILSKQHQRPLDVAACGFSFDGAMTPSHSNLNEVIGTRKVFLTHSASSRTLVLHHPECMEHIPKSESDWEVPDRINSILKVIEEEEGKLIHEYEISKSSEFDRAPLELLSRVHSAEYLTFVNDLNKEMERRKNLGKKGDGEMESLVVPFTPMVQRTMLKDTSVELGTHSDTSFSAGSLKAARRAAGAVQHSIDCVLMGRHTNAFCIVRPPGHHAGYNGLMCDSESSGFCIFNNIAAGAMHALSERHIARCKKCAIIDIDVHHGNGTEDIVRKMNDPEKIFFFSVHLFDEEPHLLNKSKNSSDVDGQKSKNSWKFYPGSGETDDVANNVINVPIAPLWREKEALQCVSSPSCCQTAENNFVQNPHNTRNKLKQKVAAAAAKASAPNVDCSIYSDLVATKNDNKCSPSSSSRPADGKNNDIPNEVSVSSKDTNSNSKSPVLPETPTPAQYLMGTGRRAYRRTIQHRLLPALRAFNPDLILMSTGFDAAKGDVGNAKHTVGGKERMGIDLEPEDYAWTTKKIVEVANICCQGRIVSVLEGGYGSKPSSTDEKLLDKSMFSKCASMHLSALVDPQDSEMRQNKREGQANLEKVHNNLDSSC